jgi:hypothetical protein
MKAQAIIGNYSDANVEAIAVAIFKDEKADSPFIKELDLLTGGIASSIIKNEEIKGNSGDTASASAKKKITTRHPSAFWREQRHGFYQNVTSKVSF